MTFPSTIVLPGSNDMNLYRTRVVDDIISTVVNDLNWRCFRVTAWYFTDSGSHNRIVFRGLVSSDFPVPNTAEGETIDRWRPAEEMRERLIALARDTRAKHRKSQAIAVGEIGADCPTCGKWVRHDYDVAITDEKEE